MARAGAEVDDKVGSKRELSHPARAVYAHLAQLMDVSDHLKFVHRFNVPPDRSWHHSALSEYHNPYLFGTPEENTKAAKQGNIEK